MNCATLVNTQTHTDKQLLAGYTISSASWANNKSNTALQLFNGRTANIHIEAFSDTNAALCSQRSRQNSYDVQNILNNHCESLSRDIEAK